MKKRLLTILGLSATKLSFGQISEGGVPTTFAKVISGDFEKYTFAEDQTGPMIIKFENIRNTGQETEFGIVVAPEFGTIASLILITSIIAVIFVTRRNLFRFSI